MSQKFQASVHHRDDYSFVKLAGVIAEDNELTDLTDKIHGSTVVIVLVECSPAIVAQINLVNNFTGNGVVKSFYVPYFCPECDEEKVLLCETSDMGPPPHEPPICRCDECDLVMDFDDMPDSYFAFLTNQKKLPRADKIQNILDEFHPGDDEKSKIRSRVGNASLTGPSLSSQSLPTVPSLPSIATRSGSRPGASFGQLGGSQPGIVTSSSLGLSQEIPGAGVVRSSGPVMFALVGVLLVAIAVLAVLLLSN
jgi:hypothetical protein